MKYHNTAGVASFSSGSILGKEIGSIAPLESPYEYIATLNEETGGFGPSKITGCRFDGNTATDGGAIYTAAGYDMVVDSSFMRNFAGSY